MEIKQDILSVADRYDALFLDVYGVLYNGVELYNNTLDTLRELKRAGKKIIIVSNATQVSADAKQSYERRGMIEGEHYDQFLTSGEYLHYTLTTKPQEIFKKYDIDILSVKCLFLGNASVFADSQVVKTESFDEAGFIYVGVPIASYGRVRIDNLYDENGKLVCIEDVVHSDWHKLSDSEGRKGTKEFAIVLEKCLEKKKILLVANPDIFAHDSDKKQNNKIIPVFTQGILGKYYERLGGKVAYFGKPYVGVFEFAKQFTSPEDKILMVGDTPWTDIAGANAAGIDSAMVMTGVAGEFLKNETLSSEQKFEFLFKNIAEKLSNVDSSVYPTHVIRQFAH